MLITGFNESKILDVSDYMLGDTDISKTINNKL